jgi:arylesterase / paraoxonase
MMSCKRALFFFLIFAMPARAERSRIEVVPIAAGCEDFAFDDSSSAARLILSCDDRRSPNSQGGFYSLDLLSHQVRLLTIKGPKPRSLHPHGISVVQRGNTSFLYAINHQRKNQSLSGKNFTQVLVFRISGHELLDTSELGIRGQELFANPNDLFATPSGEVFMSNPSSVARSILYYSPTSRAWSVAARGFIYPNGVHVRGNQVFVNTSVGGKQYTYTHTGQGRLVSRRLNARHLGAADNITENASGDLYFSGAKSFVEFLRYFLAPQYIPASNVFRLRGNSLEKLRSPDLRNVIAAPSVAFEYHDRVYLGQVFDNFVAVINNPEWIALR